MISSKMFRASWTWCISSPIAPIRRRPRVSASPRSSGRARRRGVPAYPAADDDACRACDASSKARGSAGMISPAASLSNSACCQRSTFSLRSPYNFRINSCSWWRCERVPSRTPRQRGVERASRDSFRLLIRGTPEEGLASESRF